MNIPIELPTIRHTISPKNIRHFTGADDGFIIDLPEQRNAFYIARSQSIEIYKRICNALEQGSEIELRVQNDRIVEVVIVNHNENEQNRMIAAAEL
jgi:hypothetical protein